MGSFRTGVECFLCSSTVPYSLADTSRLVHHLQAEHGANDGLEFLVAGCTMAQKERDAVQAVVHGRKPTLVRIQVDLAQGAKEMTCDAGGGGRGCG
jgi:hypothetical protein